MRARYVSRNWAALGLIMACVVFGVVAPDPVLASPPTDQLAPIPTPPEPPPLAHAEDPAFRAALAAWLADDEETGLWGFADLALTGNTAARVLLGLIDTSPSLQGPYLTQLDRATRLAILRAPGGLSGRNWLGVETGVPLAAAWQTLLQVDATPAVIDQFTALGEARAAREATIILAARAHLDLTSREAAAFDPELLFVLWQSADAARRAALEALIPPGHPQLSMIGVRIDARAVDMWLAESPAAAPLQHLCAVACPTEQATCRGAAYQALNSHTALLTMGSPAETLVSQADFLTSARGRASVLRRILLAGNMRGRLLMLDRLSQHSTCLTEALSAEHERHLPRLRDVSLPD